MQTLEGLTRKLAGYLPHEQVNAVRRAYFYSEQAHDGQVRRTGQPYVTHPLAVADILADMRMDHPSLVAALLHDVIEDSGVPKEAIAAQFGDSVAELVDGVSKLSQFESASRAEAQAENFQKMALAMARDIRVILVKLADRLHNMRTLDVLKPEKRRRIAEETLEIYAPIAMRLGMNDIRVEFEDLGFSALHPMRSRRIQAAVRKARGNRKEIVSQVQRKIEVCLADEDIPARVLGREKHLYSIYQKMRAKGRSFSEIMDVFAFRIVVSNVDSCYRVLGAMHNLYKPLPGHFKDYIAIPKANGYQSLHTVLFGMHGVPIEIQIRTEEMESMANNGIAAHWLYKSGGDGAMSGQSRARQWVQGLLEMQQRAGNSLEFIENMKIDLFPDEVYVFTPRGAILALPNGATAVDFAYAVHTDIGNSCVACRIDRALAPLSTVLSSGQNVEIVTAPGARPNPTWLSFVVTAKARSNIRHVLKTQQRSESIDLGRRMLDKALQGLGSSLKGVDARAVETLLAETRRASFDVILEEVGLGNRVAALTARRLLGPLDTGAEGNGTIAEQVPLLIRGTEGLVLNYAKCCYPLPGDTIVGHISAGRGVVVHRVNCNNVAEFLNDPERCTPLRWAEDTRGEFSSELLVELENRKGVIAAIANCISGLDMNIEKITMEERDAELSQVRVILGVADRVALARAIKRLRAVSSVLKVSRIRR